MTTPLVSSNMAGWKIPGEWILVAISSKEWYPLTPPLPCHSVKMQSEKWGWQSHLVGNNGF